MRYDDQAATFDARAGVPPEAATAIADAAVRLAGAGPGTRWLEVGAGTGLLSLPLLRHPIHYTGFDRSPAMLDRFRARLAESAAGANLVVADGDGRWPAEDGSVDVVSGARALHHLDPAHAARELRRVLRPAGGVLLLGHVRRPDGSPKAAIRRRMRRELESLGHRPRGNERAARVLLEALDAAPGAPVVAATWVVRHRPADSLLAWAGKDAVAGVELPRAERDVLLRRLRAWIESEYGDPQAPLAQEERFEIVPVRVAPAPDAATPPTPPPCRTNS